MRKQKLKEARTADIELQEESPVIFGATGCEDAVGEISQTVQRSEHKQLGPLLITAESTFTFKSASIQSL